MKVTEKEYRKALGWIFNNGFKIYCEPVNRTYAHNKIVQGKKRREIVPYVRLVIDIDGSKKRGTEEYKQNSSELENKYREIILFYYNKSH